MVFIDSGGCDQVEQCAFWLQSTALVARFAFASERRCRSLFWTIDALISALAHVLVPRERHRRRPSARFGCPRQLVMRGPCARFWPSFNCFHPASLCVTPPTCCPKWRSCFVYSTSSWFGCWRMRVFFLTSCVLFKLYTVELPPNHSHAALALT